MNKQIDLTNDFNIFDWQVDSKHFVIDTPNGARVAKVTRKANQVRRQTTVNWWVFDLLEFQHRPRELIPIPIAIARAIPSVILRTHKSRKYENCIFVTIY